MEKLITPGDFGYLQPLCSQVLHGALVVPLNEVASIFYEEQVILFSQIKTDDERTVPKKQARRKMQPPRLLSSVLSLSFFLLSGFPENSTIL